MLFVIYIGHEIAVHTLSHRTPSDYWAKASHEDLVHEIAGMKKKLESEGISNVLGYRNPFLQTAGDATFRVLKEAGFLYDSTLPVHYTSIWWPYTFDNGGPPQCVIKPCPSGNLFNHFLGSFMRYLFLVPRIKII